MTCRTHTPVAPTPLHRGVSSGYGDKVHAAVCATTGLPVAWQVETAKAAEAAVVPSLLDSLVPRGFGVDTCAMDRGYDVGPWYEACDSRGIRRWSR